MIARVLALAALLLPAAAGAAGVYKWVDRNGVVHYDDSSRLGERLSRASIANRYIEVDPRATVPEELVRDVAAACAAARERSEAYETADALYGRDPFGNTVRLTDNQVRLEVGTLQRERRRYCRPNAAERLLAEARGRS